MTCFQGRKYADPVMTMIIRDFLGKDQNAGFLFKKLFGNLFRLFGKSENVILDKFLEEKRLKWIPYNQFKNVEYFDKGGFGTIYKAIWNDAEVVLKCPNNLNENLKEFLNEWDYYENV
ncbi:hypothetical protein RclHR1_15530002 [Rhizophagus clarus]|uniref:Protein kinase domain-containing protein n=1 Tax=Rhizophagus clarus TaxID=94130 RepID=A0A2Z6QH39_9GLOM|nr:hypothetical protein RclHR1_15530002 [Rhizophagus clarus]